MATVRAVSGVPTTDVNDADMASLIKQASVHFHGDVAIRAQFEEATALNTPATRFQTDHPLLADVDIDKAITAADLIVTFVKRDSPSGAVLTSATGTVTVEDAARGIFTTATARPDGYACVVTYDYYRRPLDLTRADEAVAYLTAHLAVTRMKGPGAISRADLTGVGSKDHGNRTTAFTSHRTKYLKQYEMVLKAIRGSGGVLA